MLSHGRSLLIAILMLSGLYSPLTIAAELPLSSDFYQRLDVESTATTDEIKKSFRKLAMKYHPDRHPELDRRLFQSINEAWDTLQDQSKRTAYDRARTATMAAAKKPEPAATKPPPKPKPSPSSKAIFMALVKADEKSFAEAVAKAEALDWKDPNVEKMFLSFAEPLVRIFTSQESTKLSPEEYARLVGMIENLFGISKIGQYPQFFESILKSPRAGYFVKNILSKPLWLKHPETKNWILLAMTSESPAVTKALSTVFIEKLRTPEAKAAFLQQLVRRTPEKNHSVIADNVPVELAMNQPELRPLVRMCSKAFEP